MTNTNLPTRRRPLWLHRPLLNWQEVYLWAIASGAHNFIQPEQLHVTLATAQGNVDWTLIGEEHLDTIVVPEGEKPMARLGRDAWVIDFEHEALTRRATEIAKVMKIDHGDEFHAHMTVARGDSFIEPTHPYRGRLIFGPEIAGPFLRGTTMPRGNPINRNKFREQIGLPAHNDDAAKVAEFYAAKARKKV